ncbi:unnamed protein product [Rotaria magnacalcarata]
MSIVRIKAQPCGLPCVNGNCEIEADSLIQFCNCSAGFTGDLCDARDTTSAPPPTTTTIILGNPCLTNPCQNGGLCFNVPGGGFRCRCAPGHAGILFNRPSTCNPKSYNADGQCISTRDSYNFFCKNDRIDMLCEQMEFCQNVLYYKSAC